MNKTYKIQLPRNKEAQNIRTNIKDGTIEVEVELKEKWEPRDGDICYIKACYEHIFIFNKLDDNVIAYVAFTPCSKRLSNFNKIAIICDTDDIRKFRPATDFEKQLLFDALAKEGKMWDAQKKAVVDLPRWRAENGEEYFDVIISPDNIRIYKYHKDTESYSYIKNHNIKDNRFKTKEAAERVVKQIREIFKNSKAE